MTFQFHKGTIRTFAEFAEFARLTNFNSIKVRLERVSLVNKFIFVPISIP